MEVGERRREREEGCVETEEVGEEETVSKEWMERGEREGTRDVSSERENERTNLSRIHDLPIYKQPQAVPLSVILNPPDPELFQSSRNSFLVSGIKIYRTVIGNDD